MADDGFLVLIDEYDRGSAAGEANGNPREAVASVAEVWFRNLGSVAGDTHLAAGRQARNKFAHLPDFDILGFIVRDT